MTCYESGSSEQEGLITGYNGRCNDFGLKESEDTSSSDDSNDASNGDSKSNSSTEKTENKKNDAGSLTLGKGTFRMAGVMAVAGGLIAAM